MSLAVIVGIALAYLVLTSFVAGFLEAAYHDLVKHDYEAWRARRRPRGAGRFWDRSR